MRVGGILNSWRRVLFGPFLLGSVGDRTQPKGNSGEKEPFQRLKRCVDREKLGETSIKSYISHANGEWRREVYREESGGWATRWGKTNGGQHQAWIPRPEREK